MSGTCVESSDLPEGRLIWVSLPEFTVGMIISTGRVVYAPPIAKWARGKDERYVADYFRRRGAQIVPVDTIDRAG